MFIKSKHTRKIIRLIIAPIVWLLLVTNVNAKIEVQVERTYRVTNNLEMEVQEIHNIFNNTENLYIPAGEQVEFEILGFKTDDPDETNILKAALDSASMKRNNSPVSFVHEFGDNKITLRTNYPANFYPGAQIQYVLTYKHPGLIYKNGALSEAYIHAFGPEFKFDLINTTYSFNTKLLFPKNYENSYIIFPEPSSIEQTQDEIISNYDQSKLINQFVYLQLGKTQIYEFELVQEVNPTESKYTGLTNRYELVIPRNFKNNTIEQSVLIKTIEPEPIYLKKDEEGNIIGAFDFYSDQQTTIKVHGYGVLKIDSSDFKSQVGQIKDIPKEVINKYTNSSKYWEVDNQQIVKTAQSLSAYDNNVYELTVSAYKFIVDSIDYSQVKKFGLNERQGAVATLNGGAAVCMEYSDLFLTLMRARGIPARAVFGYGYDPMKAKEQQEAHQWVQIYMPGLEHSWVDVDVTWGEGGNTLIGGDLNHFYTHFAYENPNTPNVIARNSFGNSAVENLTAPKINIAAVHKLPENTELTNIDEIVVRYNTFSESETEFTIKQFLNRYKAGFTGLVTNPDLSNTSQLITVSTIFLVSVIIFYILAPLYNFHRRKK